MTDIQGSGIIETEQGKSFVHVVGAGKPILIVHGGPGFDHDYLVKPLTSLAEKRRLIFYDQPGCGQTPIKDPGSALDQTYRQFLEVAQTFSQDGMIGVIAHSWGALVIAGGLAFGKPASEQLSITEGLLVNPTPVDSSNYMQALNETTARLPPDLIAQITTIMLGDEDGSQIMSLLAPYYTSHMDRLPVDIFPLSKIIYLLVNEQLGEFDFRTQLGNFNNLTVVQGEDDITSQEFIKDIWTAAKKNDVIKDAGHFPFFERPDEFNRILDREFPV